MTVNVLGVEYTIKESNKAEDPILEDSDGYCDQTTKTVVIDDLKSDMVDSVKDLDEYKKQIIRHELVHAFLFESGLGNSSWGKNEEIVDWIAYQFPKIKNAFEEIKAI